MIDDALRTAAYERGVNVRLMGSYWNHTDHDMVKFLASLSADWGIGSCRGNIQTVSSFELGDIVGGHWVVGVVWVGFLTTSISIRLAVN